MIWKRKMREAFQTKRSARIIAVLTGAVIAVAAAGYLFFHNPHQYPLPCLFHITIFLRIFLVMLFNKSKIKNEILSLSLI